LTRTGLVYTYTVLSLGTRMFHPVFAKLNYPELKKYISPVKGKNLFFVKTSEGSGVKYLGCEGCQHSRVGSMLVCKLEGPLFKSCKAANFPPFFSCSL
jgi:hypothetical protein